MKRKLSIISIFLFVLFVSGCLSTATTTYYLGAKADETGVVYLYEERAEQQQWQDLYVTVNYSFTRQRDQFNIDGLFSFSDSPKITYDTVYDVKLKFFLLDKDMLVVDYLDISRTLGRDIEDNVAFNQDLVLAENVVAFTFGYEGLFGDDEGNGYVIMKLPKLDF